MERTMRFTIGTNTIVHNNSCGIWNKKRDKAHDLPPETEVTCWRCLSVDASRIRRSHYRKAMA